MSGNHEHDTPSVAAACAIYDDGIWQGVVAVCEGVPRKLTSKEQEEVNQFWESLSAKNSSPSLKLLCSGLPWVQE
jgi:hypothetical protein